jgi:hypothetical protein
MHARAALPYAHAGGHCSASACTALNSLGARATPRGPSLAMPEKFTSWPKNLFLHQFFTHRSCIPGKTGGTLQSFRGHRRANKHGPARRAAELARSIDTADAELSLRRRRVNETARRRVRSTYVPASVAQHNQQENVETTTIPGAVQRDANACVDLLGTWNSGRLRSCL